MSKKSKMIRKPRTHSEILWHFTGGPKWDSRKDCPQKSLKPLKLAYENLQSILEGKTLKVGGYHEKININLGKVKELKKVGKKVVVEKSAKDVIEIVPTTPVCCVADIPFEELFYHGGRYGKVGVGFKRSSLIKGGFNPVLYTLEKEWLVKSYYNAERLLRLVNKLDVVSEVEGLVDDALSEAQEALESFVTDGAVDN